MNADPLGYYTRLGVRPGCPPTELKSAFRRRARELHPDAPTGDSVGFMRLKEAYEVLSDPLQRAAYDRTIGLMGRPQGPGLRGAPLPPRTPRPRQGPWFAGAGVAVIGVAVGLIAARHPASRYSGEAPRISIPGVLPGGLSLPLPIPLGAPDVLVQEPGDHYVLPRDGSAIVWQGNGNGRLRRLGRLAPFTSVRVAPRDTPAPDGLTGIVLRTGAVAYVDAGRLMPGSTKEARQARCAYEAGRPPGNGEVLPGGRGGRARATLSNASSTPAVVTLRGSAPRDVARIYVAPNDTARVTGLPPGPWTAEAAFGDLWSRACDSFVAGERMQRIAAPVMEDGELTLGAEAPGR